MFSMTVMSATQVHAYRDLQKHSSDLHSLGKFSHSELSSIALSKYPFACAINQVHLYELLEGSVDGRPRVDTLVELNSGLGSFGDTFRGELELLVDVLVCTRSTKSV